MKTSTMLLVGGAVAVGYVLFRGRAEPAVAAPSSGGVKPMPPPIFSPEAASSVVTRLKTLLVIPPPPPNALPEAEIRKKAASWWASGPQSMAALVAYLRALHRAYWPAFVAELVARGANTKTVLEAALAAAGLVQR